MSEKKINRDYNVSFLTSGFNPLATTLWKQLVPVQCISCGLTNLFWTKPMYYNQSILTGVSLAWNQNDLTVWTSKWQWNGLGSHQNCYFVSDLLSTLSTQNLSLCSGMSSSSKDLCTKLSKTTLKCQLKTQKQVHLSLSPLQASLLLLSTIFKQLFVFQFDPI